MKIISLILILPFIALANFALAQEKISQDCKTSEKLVLENQAMLEQVVQVREEKAKLGLEINELRDRLKDKEISFQENLSVSTQPCIEKALKLEKDLADINQKSSQKLSESESQIRQSLEQQLQESKQGSENEKNELLQKVTILEAKVKELTGIIETKESLSGILKTKTDQLEQSNGKISKESETLVAEVQTLKNTVSQLNNDLSSQSKSLLKSTQDYENLLVKYNQLSAESKEDSFKLKQSDSREQNLKAAFDEQTKKLKSEFEAREADYVDQKAKLQSMVNDHDEFVNNLKEDNLKLKSNVGELAKTSESLKENLKKLTEESTAKIDALETNVVNAESPYKEKTLALEAKIQKFADECNESIAAVKAPLIEKILDAEEKLKNQNSTFENQMANINSCQEKIKGLEAEQALLKNKVSESQEKVQQANEEFNQKLKKSLETSQGQLNHANSELSLCQNNRSQDVSKRDDLLEQNKKLLEEVTQLKNVKAKLEFDLEKKVSSGQEQAKALEQKIKEKDEVVSQKDLAINKILSDVKELNIQLNKMTNLKSDLEKSKAELILSLNQCQDKAVSQVNESENKCNAKYNDLKVELDLKSKIEKEQNQIKVSLENENKKLKDLVNVSKIDAEQLTQKIGVLENNFKGISLKSNQETQQRNQEADLKLKVLNDSLDASGNQLRTVEASLQETNKQNKDLSKQLALFKKENDELKSALMGKDSAQALLENNVSQIKSDASLRVEAITSQLSEKIKLADVLNDLLLKTKEELKQKSDHLESLQLKVQDSQVLIDQLGQEKKKMSESITALDKQLVSQDSENKENFSKKDLLQKENLNLKEVVVTVDKQKAELSSKLETLSKEKDSLNQKLKVISDELALVKNKSESEVLEINQKSQSNRENLKAQLIQLQKSLDIASNELIQRKSVQKTLDDLLKAKEADILKLKEQAASLNQQSNHSTQQFELIKNQSTQSAAKVDVLTKENVALNQSLNESKNQLVKLNENAQVQLAKQKNEYENNLSQSKAELSKQEKLLENKSTQATEQLINAQALDKKLLIKNEESARLKGQVDALSFKILELEKSYAKDLAGQKEKHDVALRQVQRSQGSIVDENNSLKNMVEEMRLLKISLEVKLKDLTHQLEQVKAETQAKLIQEGYLSPKEVVSLKTSIKFLEKRLLDAENKLEEISHKDDLISGELNKEPVLNK